MGPGDHKALRAKLVAVYGEGGIDTLDPFVGMLAEPAVRGAVVGELCRAAIADQFGRIRDGDRFWFEAEDSALPSEETASLPTLAQIIARNTAASDIGSPFVLRQSAASASCEPFGLQIVAPILMTRRMPCPFANVFNVHEKKSCILHQH